MDEEFIRTVVQDLEYLRDHWEEGASDDVIRRGSVLLRRLLVNDDYGRAWRDLGFEKEPQIEAWEVDTMLEAVPAEQVEAMMPGAAVHEGLEIGTVVLAHPEIRRRMEAATGGEPPQRTMYLSEFLDSTAARAGQYWLTRRELILYMANVRGGAHFGGERKRSRQIKHNSRQIEGRIQIMDLDGLFFQLLSIGQNLGASNDAGRLIERAETFSILSQ